jgi:hypothetical protein
MYRLRYKDATMRPHTERFRTYDGARAALWKLHAKGFYITGLLDPWGWPLPTH